MNGKHYSDKLAHGIWFDETVWLGYYGKYNSIISKPTQISVKWLKILLTSHTPHIMRMHETKNKEDSLSDQQARIGKLTSYLSIEWINVSRFL